MPANVYECMFLLDTNKMAGDEAGTLKHLQGLIERNHGEVLATGLHLDQQVSEHACGSALGIDRRQAGNHEEPHPDRVRLGGVARRLGAAADQQQDRADRCQAARNRYGRCRRARPRSHPGSRAPRATCSPRSRTPSRRARGSRRSGRGRRAMRADPRPTTARDCPRTPLSVGETPCWPGSSRATRRVHDGAASCSAGFQARRYRRPRLGARRVRR